jgi:hypothetical protein
VGFVGFVVGDLARRWRSAGPGLLVEFGEQCDVGRIFSPAGFALDDEIPLLVHADPVHGVDARVVGGEGPGGQVIGLGDGFFAPRKFQFGVAVVVVGAVVGVAQDVLDPQVDDDGFGAVWQQVFVVNADG